MTRAIGSRVEAVAGGRCINFHTDVTPRTLQVHLTAAKRTWNHFNGLKAFRRHSFLQAIAAQT